MCQKLQAGFGPTAHCGANSIAVLILQVGISPALEKTTTARVEVLDLPRVRPYVGAKNETGRFGYVNDPKFLHCSSQFIMPPEERGEICPPPYQGPEDNGSVYDARETCPMTLADRYFGQRTVAHQLLHELLVLKASEDTNSYKTKPRPHIQTTPIRVCI